MQVSKNGPKNQSGAALIVVLVMMSLGIMLSLSAVQSSVIGEKLAGNYRAMTQAEMNAERGLSEFHEWLADSDCESDGWKSDKDNLSWDGYDVTYVSDCVGGYVTVTAEGHTGGAVGIANATFKKPGLPNIQADAAFTCFGDDCNFVIGSANANSGKHLAASGIDYRSQCFSGNVGNATPLPGGVTKAGVIMPDGELSDQSESGSGGGPPGGGPPGGGGGSDTDDSTSVPGIDGAPALVTNDEQYNTVNGVESDSQLDNSDEGSGLRQRIKDYYDTLYEMVEKPDSPEDFSVEGEGVYYAGEGTTVSIPNNANASGVIILDGGTLDMGGQACFQGLVIARPSVESMPQITSNGTPVILGAVMGEGLTVGQVGNPNILYSSEALDFEDEGAPGGDKPIQIKSWVAGEAAEEKPE